MPQFPYYFGFLSCRTLSATKAFNFFRYAFSALRRCTSARRFSSTPRGNCFLSLLYSFVPAARCTGLPGLPQGRFVPIFWNGHYSSRINDPLPCDSVFLATAFLQLLFWSPLYVFLVLILAYSNTPFVSSIPYCLTNGVLFTGMTQKCYTLYHCYTYFFEKIQKPFCTKNYSLFFVIK